MSGDDEDDSGDDDDDNGDDDDAIFHLPPVLRPIKNVSNRGVQTSDDVAVELKNPTGSQNCSEKVKVFSFVKII